MKITGTSLDNMNKNPKPNAVAMAVRLSDSVMVKFARTNGQGMFLLEIPVDTYQIVVSHPDFGEQVFIVVGSEKNKEFDFGRIVLPPKSIALNEVTIVGFKDPVYFKGDTLVYNADSFKVKPNATVEDLLKKLPGIKVDKQGKITVQGKEIDQVLVDGDEFFGTDPTMATKNLNAKTVESVQVYEKKNENATEDGDKETLQVMNLQLKEDAKNGYFGKISGASDFDKFYEGELLVNKFHGSKKISIFALASNTPRSQFGWSDMWKYGLNNEMNMTEMDDEGMGYYYMDRGPNQGIPKTLRTGLYYTDKLSKKTKLTINYTYNPNRLTAESNSESQYFFSDSTINYRTVNSGNSFQSNESHSLNFTVVQTLDSMTELQITPRIKFTPNKFNNNNTSTFYNASDSLTRRTVTDYSGNGKNYDIGSILRLTKDFKKKERKLMLIYNFGLSGSESENILIYHNYQPFIDTSTFFIMDSINQKKENQSFSQSHNPSVIYTEPLTKKVKVEFSYEFSYHLNTQKKETFKNQYGEYTQVDSFLSNDFKNTRNIHRIGGQFIYEVKKQRLTVGGKFRYFSMSSENVQSNTTLKQELQHILPQLDYSYKFSDNERFYFRYRANSTPPSISQLQPVQDNSNPNRITLGDAGLRPTYDHSIIVNYYLFRPVSGRNIWSNASFNISKNAFSSSLDYDSQGRTITQPINAKGHYSSNAYIGGDFPLYEQLIKINPELNFNYSHNNNLINKIKNTTTETTIGGGLSFDVELDTINFSVGANYEYNIPSATVSTQSNQPYNYYELEASLDWKLPKKFKIETEATYTVNQRELQGEKNLNYIIWNASVSKALLKNENLIVGIEAKDMLNQNINYQRLVSDNVITDTKTSLIRRYVLLRLTYKFNSTKKKEEGEDEEY